MDWKRWPNFGPEEFRCKHTGKLHMHAGFMDRLQRLRTAYGKPMRITSGYRSPEHPIESAKAQPGAHATGRACDVAVQGSDALRLIVLAERLGFTGIGVQQKGTGRFIHLDDLPASDGRPRPHIWSY
jgi:zinc D-Ala-D-Ala carboxypeptidase